VPSSSLPTFAPLVPLSPRPGFEPPTLPFRVEPLSLSELIADSETETDSRMEAAALPSSDRSVSVTS
jgi:hypothetical protein